MHHVTVDDLTQLHLVSTCPIGVQDDPSPQKALVSHSRLRMRLGPGARALVAAGLRRNSRRDSGRPPSTKPPHCSHAGHSLLLPIAVIQKARLQITPTSICDGFLLAVDELGSSGVKICRCGRRPYHPRRRVDGCSPEGCRWWRRREQRPACSNPILCPSSDRRLGGNCGAKYGSGKHASRLRAPVHVSIPLLAILQGPKTCGSALRAFGRLLEDTVLHEQLDECKRALVEKNLDGASPLFPFFSAPLGGQPMPDIRDFDGGFLFMIVDGFLRARVLPRFGAGM